MFYLLVVFLFSLLVLCFLIVGEYFVSKYPESKFKKWWNSNIITHVKDDYQ